MTEGEKLRADISKKGIEIKKLSQISGVSRRSIYNYFESDSIPKDKAGKLYAVLNDGQPRAGTIQISVTPRSAEYLLLFMENELREAKQEVDNIVSEFHKLYLQVKPVVSDIPELDWIFDEFGIER